MTERTRRGVLTDDGRAGELEALLFLFPVYLACVVRNKTYRTHPTQTRKGAVWNKVPVTALLKRTTQRTPYLQSLRLGGGGGGELADKAEDKTWGHSGSLDRKEGQRL